MMTSIRVLNTILWVGVILVLGLVVFRMYNPLFLGGHSEWNALPANIATILFLAILLPGSLQRIGVSMQYLKYLIVFRRTVGIAMYLFALLHFLFLIDYLPWFSDDLVEGFDSLTATGVAMVIILLPALITSNNASVRLLGKWWKVIQRVTYVILPLIAIHLWESESILLAILVLLTTLLIIISYYTSLMRKGSSVLWTSLTMLGIVIFACGIAYLTVQLLFKNPADARRALEATENQERIGELENEKILLQTEIDRKESLLVAEQAKVAEFERIEREKREAQEAIVREAEAAKKKEEEEKAAATAEAARVAALTTYVNGTYTGVGTYSTDKGDKTERIDARLGIVGDVVTSVEIISHAKATKSVKYVGRFKKDIAGVIVGKSVDSLNVHGIGGASDTSTGFRTALASIKAQARQK